MCASLAFLFVRQLQDPMGALRKFSADVGRGAPVENTDVLLKEDATEEMLLATDSRRTCVAISPVITFRFGLSR